METGAIKGSGGYDGQRRIAHLEKKIPGAYNVADDGVVRASEIGALIGKRILKIPRGLNYLLIWLLWHLHLKWIEAPPDIVDYSSYPWILDTSRAKNFLE